MNPNYGGEDFCFQWISNPGPLDKPALTTIKIQGSYIKFLEVPPTPALLVQLFKAL